MTIDNAQTLMDELDDLLDAERRALVGGDMDAVGRLLSQKEHLIEGLNKIHDLDSGNLSQLHLKVTRNQALLNSALEGIRAVATRMAELRRVRSGLETYDSHGRKQHFTIIRAAQVEKRA